MAKRGPESYLQRLRRRHTETARRAANTVIADLEWLQEERPPNDIKSVQDNIARMSEAMFRLSRVEAERAQAEAARMAA